MNQVFDYFCPDPGHLLADLGVNLLECGPWMRCSPLPHRLARFVKQRIPIPLSLSHLFPPVYRLLLPYFLPLAPPLQKYDAHPSGLSGVTFLDLVGLDWSSFISDRLFDAAVAKLDHSMSR